MSSSVHTDNKKKDILILGLGPTQGLVDTTLTAEAQYLINFSKPSRKFCLRLHWTKNFLFLNATKMCSFKAKDSEIKKNILCVLEIFQDFLSANNMKK